MPPVLTDPPFPSLANAPSASSPSPPGHFCPKLTPVRTCSTTSAVWDGPPCLSPPPPPGWGSAGVWADCPPAHWPSSSVGGCPRPAHPQEGPDEGPTPGGACDHGDGHLRTTAPLALAATLGSVHWLLTCGKVGWEPAAPPPRPTSPGPPLTVRLGLRAPPGLGGSPPPGGTRRAGLLLLSGLFSHRVSASLWAAAGKGTGSAGQSRGLGSGRRSVRVRRGGAGRRS